MVLLLLILVEWWLQLIDSLIRISALFLSDAWVGLCLVSLGAPKGYRYLVFQDSFGVDGMKPQQ